MSSPAGYVHRLKKKKGDSIMGYLGKRQYVADDTRERKRRINKSKKSAMTTPYVSFFFFFLIPTTPRDPALTAPPWEK
jgi:hypothetical protein